MLHHFCSRVTYIPTQWAWLRFYHSVDESDGDSDDGNEGNFWCVPRGEYVIGMECVFRPSHIEVMQK